MVKVLNKNKTRAILDVPVEFINLFQMVNPKKVKFTDEFSDKELRAIRSDVRHYKNHPEQLVDFDEFLKQNAVTI